MRSCLVLYINLHKSDLLNLYKWKHLEICELFVPTWLINQSRFYMAPFRTRGLLKALVSIIKIITTIY